MDTNFNTIAQRFTSLRSAHSKETTEDYIEMIYDLLQYNSVARIKDLAECMGVSHPTVKKITLRLEKEGYIATERYKGITLTDTGLALALHCKERHTIVKDFLLSLGVSVATAEIDAEGIEHHVSTETIEIFKDFIKNKAEKNG